MIGEIEDCRSAREVMSSTVNFGCHARALCNISRGLPGQSRIEMRSVPRAFVVDDFDRNVSEKKTKRMDLDWPSPNRRAWRQSTEELHSLRKCQNRQSLRRSCLAMHLTKFMLADRMILVMSRFIGLKSKGPFPQLHPSSLHGSHAAKSYQRTAVLGMRHFAVYASSREEVRC